MTAPASDEICSLSEDELRERIAMIRREIAPHALSQRERADGIDWDFPARPELRAKLENLIGLERQCCGGLAWSLSDGRASTERLTLGVSGVDPKTFGALMGVSPSTARAPGRLGLIARAAGIGFGASFLICCVLPMALAALLGAAVAAPFASLDEPVVIVAASAAFAVPTWWWLQRRRENLAAGACGDDC